MVSIVHDGHVVSDDADHKLMRRGSHGLGVSLGDSPGIEDVVGQQHQAATHITKTSFGGFACSVDHFCFRFEHITYKALMQPVYIYKYVHLEVLTATPRRLKAVRLT